MKRFLQGLGLGLVVAAIIMGVGTRGNSSITSETVVERARELGMVFPAGTSEPLDNDSPDEGEVAPETSGEAASGSAGLGAGVGGDMDAAGAVTTDEPAPTVTPDETDKPDKTKKPVKTPKPKETEKPETTKAPSTPKPKETAAGPNATPSTHKELPKGTKVKFKVRSGLLSSSVARELYEAGIISDMWAFDHYIEEHGLGHNIIAGTYELTVGDSYASIAKIITHG